MGNKILYIFKCENNKTKKQTVPWDQNNEKKNQTEDEESLSGTLLPGKIFSNSGAKTTAEIHQNHNWNI